MNVWDLTPILRGQAPVLKVAADIHSDHVVIDKTADLIPIEYIAMSTEELARKTRKLYTQAVKRHKAAIENLHSLMLDVDKLVAKNREAVVPTPYNIGTKVWFDKFIEEEGPPTAYGNPPVRVFGEVTKVIWGIPKWRGAETFLYSVKTPEGDIHVEEHKTIHTQ